MADPTAAVAANGEMTVSRGEPAPRPTDHAGHDPLLVAEAADRGGRLPATLAACPDCVALHADLIHLAAAIPLSPVPARPRAYTLDPADAARLRPAGWRRWLAAIGTSRDAVTRPLAVGLTTIGLAGLLVATVPGFLPTGAGTAGASAVDDPAPVENEIVLRAPAAAASGPPGPGDAAGRVGGDTSMVTADPERTDRAGGDDRSPLVWLSGSLVAIGGGLLAVRWIATRSRRPRRRSDAGRS